MSDFVKFVLVVIGVITCAFLLLYLTTYDSEDNHTCIDNEAYDRYGTMWIKQSPIRYCISNNEVVRKIKN
jgi:hypothetical protein